MLDLSTKPDNSTQRLLCNAFISQASKKGSMDGLSVSEICKEAGVSRGLFYRYYEDIVDMQEQIVGWLSEQVKDTIPSFVRCLATNVFSEEFIEKIHIVSNVIKSWPEYGTLIRNIDSNIFYVGMSNEYLAETKKLAEEFHLDEDKAKSYEYLMLGVGKSYYSIIITWCLNGSAESAEELAAILRQAEASIVGGETIHSAFFSNK